MTAYEIKKMYIPIAQQLGDYTKIPFNTVADKLCEAMDNNKEPEKTQYFACVILKFLPYMINYYTKWQGVYSFDDVYDKAVDAVFYQLQPKYRSWQKDSEFYKGHSAQQAFIQTLMHRFAELPYESNLDIHKANYNTESTDAPIGDDEDGRTFGDLLPAEDTDITAVEDGARSMAQLYIDKGRPVDAIILDTIAYNDTMKHTKKVIKKKVQQEIQGAGGVKKVKEKIERTYEVYSEHWDYAVVKILSNLPENYAKYFSGKYKISPEACEAAVNAIRTANNSKLYRYLRKTKISAKEFVGMLLN